ncbi:MAG: heme-copper oxidase subunit III [Bacteroidetes bacterium]|nr:heme-copper oxidase subunit III [Bacteroidota bacterium]
MMNKLMMKLVVGTEAMFFLSLIVAFVYFSLSPAFKVLQLGTLDIKTTGIFSALLFFSSFTFWRADANFRKGRTQRLKFWLLVTILLGFVFLLGQAKEYMKLLNEHVNLASSTFGTSFFTLTGFHGLHVLVGLIILTIVTCLAFMGDFDVGGSSVISTVGIYWHFVDIVWAFVFFVVYVSPHLM